MMLLTKENLAALPPLGSQEKKGLDALAVVKFFCPWNSWTWWASEYDPADGVFFGLVDGHEAELGYFSLTELEAVRGPAGLKIERDRHYTAEPLRGLVRKAEERRDR